MVYHLKFILVNFICIISMQYDISHFFKKIFFITITWVIPVQILCFFFKTKLTYIILVKKLKDKKSIQILKRYKIISLFFNLSLN